VTDPVISKPILVRASQGLIDTLVAALRLIIVILSAAPAAILLVKKHDLIGLYDYLHNDAQGVALAGALSGLAAIVYGLWKSYKRGAQVATVAADPKVPPSVADLK
jgi:hypothetical protein